MVTFKSYQIGTDLMFRISKLADYAVVLLAELANGDLTRATTADLAMRTSLPEPTVAKVVKLLAKAGLLETQRGARGGYRLAKPLDSISVAAVLTLFDGPIAMTTCVESSDVSLSGAEGGCRIQHQCRMRGRWSKVTEVLRQTFDDMTIADLLDQPRICGKSSQQDKHLWQ
jgi:FeS assembly SUF system regulator